MHALELLTNKRWGIATAQKKALLNLGSMNKLQNLFKKRTCMHYCDSSFKNVLHVYNMQISFRLESAAILWSGQ